MSREIIVDCERLNGHAYARISDLMRAVSSGMEDSPPEFAEAYRAIYILLDELELGISAACPRCERTSYHPKDIEHRYCGAYHAFHDEMTDIERLKAKIQEGFDLADRATPGPWEACLGSGLHECTAIHFVGNEQYPYGLFVCDLLPDWVMEKKYKPDIEFKAPNMEFIVDARTRVPALSRALLIAIEALNGIPATDPGWARRDQICGEALAAIEKELNKNE